MDGERHPVNHPGETETVHAMLRILVLPAALMGAGCSVFGGRAAPEPDHRVVVSEPPFEIRVYPPLTVALTTAEGDWSGAVRRGFGRLFDYIGGANVPAAEVPMTAPVLTEPRGRSIPMTAPVAATPDADAWQVMFVLPPEYTAATAPRPTDPAVDIATLPARRMAVVRFSGFLDDDSIAEARDRLAAWLADRPEEPAGPWQAAGYNPPWTLPWLRRNEVMVPVTGGD